MRARSAIWPTHTLASLDICENSVLPLFADVIDLAAVPAPLDRSAMIVTERRPMPLLPGLWR